MSELDLSLRLATDLDVEKIYCWLLEQEQCEVHGSFLCNWNLTLEIHGEKQLIVAVLSDEPVAYIWKDFGILEVRESFRRMGIGKRLVEFAMNHARNEGEYAISIECAPETSIPFWKKMGFELYSRNEASIVIQKNLRMPSNGEPVSVEISYYPEAAKWNSDISPVKSFLFTALRDSGGIVHLENRATAFISREQYNGDAMVKICLDGEEIYFDKARYSGAQKLGVTYNSGAFCIEQVHA